MEIIRALLKINFSTNNLCSLICRRAQLPKYIRRTDASHAHGIVNRSDAVHLFEYQRVRNEAAPGDCALWPDAHAGHQSVRVAVRACRGGKARNHQFNL